MTDEGTFIAAIQADPSNDTLRLAYADWLEESGDPRGDFLRAQCRLAKIPRRRRFRTRPERRLWSALHRQLLDLRPRIDSAWLAAIDRTRIENCSVRFEFRCPRRWEKLQATDEEGVRFCETCRMQVYHCRTVQEAQQHAWQGHCVAIDSSLERSDGDLRTTCDQAMVLGLVPLPRLHDPEFQDDHEHRDGRRPYSRERWTPQDEE